MSLHSAYFCFFVAAVGDNKYQYLLQKTACFLQKKKNDEGEICTVSSVCMESKWWTVRLGMILLQFVAVNW